MAIRGLMLLAMVLATAAAQTKDKEEDESRLIITSAGGDDNLINVTVGLNTAILVSLALIGVALAVVLVSRIGDEGKEQPTYHSAPSSYSADTHEKSYSVHSFIEKAAARYL